MDETRVSKLMLHLYAVLLLVHVYIIPPKKIAHSSKAVNPEAGHGQSVIFANMHTRIRIFLFSHESE